MAERYNRDYHEPPIMREHDEAFAAYVKEHYREGDRVLDLGCGPASLWKFWKKEFREPGCLIGVDLSEGMIAECKKNYPDDDFRIGSAFEIPAQTGSIDVLIASSVFHHIPDEKLPEVFKEIQRVLDEHGIIVGREPVSQGKLGDVDGWFSGAIMNFRHLVYRLTHTREYPEPENGEHHHAYNPKEFMEILGNYFLPKGIRFKFPVSSYVARCKSPLVAKIAKFLDDSVEHTGGHGFFYIASKNFSDAEDVRYCIEKELKNNAAGLRQPMEFLALLQKAAEKLEKELKEKGKGS